MAKLLPFYGPQRLITSSLTPDGPIAWPAAVTVTYGLAMLAFARLAVARRVEVTRHARTRGGQIPNS